MLRQDVCHNVQNAYKLFTLSIGKNIYTPVFFLTFSVKRNPSQQSWLLTEPIWGRLLAEPEGPKFEAEGREQERGS